MVGQSGPAWPAWLNAAAARFHCRPGRGHIVAAARLQLAVVGDGCVCVTGDVRNDIYMTLMQGELRRGGAGKVTDKNVEVTIMVCSNDGEVIPVRVARFLHSPRKSMLKLY